MSTTYKYPILVPFDKELIKQLKTTCRIIYNGDTKLWYAPNKRVYDLEIMVPYHIKYVNIPFCLKDEGKKLGLKFDGEKKQWFTSNMVYEEQAEFFNRCLEDDALFAPDPDED
jgi:hypothetical protein